VEAMTLGQRVAVLNGGRLQQAAAPRELYERPANTFVAGFIGNPPMNLFTSRVAAGADGQAAIRLGGQTAPIPCALAAWEGRTLTVGIRPEALGLVADPTAPGIPATVADVEYLGHETLARVKVESPGADGAVDLVARLAGMRALAKGDAVRLQVAGSQIYLFDADGDAID